jgi:PAS domain S-box-containing protein
MDDGLGSRRLSISTDGRDTAFERLSRALTASGLIGVWDGNMVNGVVYADENFARIYGIDAGQAVAGQPSRYHFQFVHPDDRPAMAEKFDALLASGEAFSSEHRIIRPDGVQRWVLARGRMSRTESGAPLRFTGVSIDITERKAEEARQAFLLALQDELRALSDPDEILRAAAGALGRHLGANRIGYGRVLGEGGQVSVTCAYTCGAAVVEGVFALDAFGAENFARLSAGETVVHDDVLAGGGGREMWERIGTRAHVSVPMRRDGVYRGTLFVSFVEPHAWSGEEIGLIEAVAGRLWEAAERARAERTVKAAEAARQADEARLVASEKMFRSFAQAMPHHIWSAGPDGVIDWFNDRVFEYSGLTPAELLGAAGWRLAVHPDDVALVAANRAAMAAGGALEMEYRLRRADGVYRWFARRAVPVRDADGRLLWWLGTATDIHEQKSGAEALAALNASLEAQIEQRTAELMAAEAALRQSQKMEAVGQLTGGIAHDFNNMLQGIAGSLELMERRVKQGRQPEAETFLAAARDGIARAAALTHQLLAFSRRQALASKRVELPALLDGIAGLIQQTAGPAIEFVRRVPADCWAVRCDPNQLENAILNLAINARDAMAAGGRLTVAAEHAWLDEAAVKGFSAAAGAYVRISVIDTGAGMSAEVMEHAFEPFFTTKPAGQGTGLGLSQVYGFARQSNGILRLESVPGQGTSVHMFLPRDVSDAAGTAASPDGPRLVKGKAAAKILLVEDETEIRDFAAEVLREIGYVVETAADGASGLAVLRGEAGRDAGLLIADVGLPGGLNGLQLANAAREVVAGLPVLLITGYAGGAVGQNVPAWMRVLKKPFSWQQLAEAVGAAVGG